MFTHRAFFDFVMAAILLAASGAPQAQNPAPTERLEKQVQEYEAGDRKNAPSRDAMLIAGDLLATAGPFQSFVAFVRARLPGVRIAYSSITPGPARWRRRHSAWWPTGPSRG